MMHAIGKELRMELVERKCPTPVVDGPELAKSLPTHERIVIESIPDAFTHARGQRQNAKHRLSRAVGGKITIYAQSTRAGATPFEHEDRTDRILDAVLCGLHAIAAKRGVAWSPKSGRYVPIADLAKSDVPPGVVYELTFSMDRAVRDTEFQGAIAAEATVGANGLEVTNTTQVSLATPPEEDAPGPETSCGGDD